MSDDATRPGAGMAKRRPGWVKDVKVIAGFALLNVVLTYPCGFALQYAEWMYDSPSWVTAAWWWLFTAPPALVRDLGWEAAVHPALWLNPFLYGLMWWGIWRAVKLFRTSPAD